MIRKIGSTLLVALFAAGCGGTITGMSPVTGPADYSPAEGAATVIFVRHSNLGKKINFPVVDRNGAFVASLRGKMHAVVQVAPGTHSFFVLAENAEQVDLEAEAGRVYVIETRPRMGWGKARVTVEGVHRGSERFGEAGTWIRSTPAHRPNAAEGATWAAEHADSIRSKVARAANDFREADEEYRAARSLGVGDGYLPEEINW